MVSDAERHLSLLTDRLPDELLLPIVRFADGCGPQVVATAGRAQRFDAVRAVARHRSDSQVYVGVGAIDVGRMKALQRSGRRGGRSDVTAVIGTWLDLDVAGPTHSTANLPPTKSDALALLARFPTPTCVVDTSGGLQACWLFDEPAIRGLSNIGTVAKRWSSVAQHFADEHGWHVDQVGDLARVLRIAGTYNTKAGRPRAVHLTDHGDESARYTLAELDAWSAAQLPVEQPTQSTDDVAGPARRALAASRQRRSSSGNELRELNSGPNVLQAVDVMPWSKLWPSDWQRVDDDKRRVATVNGQRVELWRRPGASSTHSATCWPDGGCYVHSSAVPGLPVGPYSRAQVLAWRTGQTVSELARSLYLSAQAKRRRS